MIGIQEKEEKASRENKEDSEGETSPFERPSTKQGRCVKSREREKEREAGRVSEIRQREERMKSMRDNKGRWAMRFVLPERE